MRLLICGTRGASMTYEQFLLAMKEKVLWFGKPAEIVEGCCPNSPDKLAERFAEEQNIPINHFPANSGSYLKRNIEMIEASDEVLAFWDSWSYGTAHVIANAVMRGKPVKIIKVEK